MPKTKWLKIATRNLPFVRTVMFLESFTRYKQAVNWDYGNLIVTYDDGIITLYRSKDSVKKYLNNFKKIENKSKFFRAIGNKIKKIVIRKKNFEKLYADFIDFWSLANLPLALENALRNMDETRLLAKYQKDLLKLRDSSQNKILKLEQLLDKSVKARGLFLATPEEIISHKKISKKNLRQRHRSVLILKDNRIKIITGPTAETWFDLVDKTSMEEKVIRGQVAYPGNVKGRVKVIFYKKDLAKLKKRDILVSPMTEVDFFPYLKKVSAVITDEGGLTCHAAITARELKIPCIIGTKNATKILKDGDLVEFHDSQVILIKK